MVVDQGSKNGSFFCGRHKWMTPHVQKMSHIKYFWTVCDILSKEQLEIVKELVRKTIKNNLLWLFVIYILKWANSKDRHVCLYKMCKMYISFHDFNMFYDEKFLLTH